MRNLLRQFSQPIEQSHSTEKCFDSVWRELEIVGIICDAYLPSYTSYLYRKLNWNVIIIQVNHHHHHHSEHDQGLGLKTCSFEAQGVPGPSVLLSVFPYPAIPEVGTGRPASVGGFYPYVPGGLPISFDTV
jgi:hypothetical protein